MKNAFSTAILLTTLTTTVYSMGAGDDPDYTWQTTYTPRTQQEIEKDRQDELDNLRTRATNADTRATGAEKAAKFFLSKATLPPPTQIASTMTIQQNLLEETDLSSLKIADNLSVYIIGDHASPAYSGGNFDPSKFNKFWRQLFTNKLVSQLKKLGCNVTFVGQYANTPIAPTTPRNVLMFLNSDDLTPCIPSIDRKSCRSGSLQLSFVYLNFSEEATFPFGGTTYSCDIGSPAAKGDYFDLLAQIISFKQPGLSPQSLKEILLSAVNSDPRRAEVNRFIQESPTLSTSLLKYGNMTTPLT